MKVPLGTWLLPAPGSPCERQQSAVGLGAFATPVLAMTLLTDINLGLRYVPALPFAFLLAGGGSNQSGRCGGSCLPCR